MQYKFVMFQTQAVSPITFRFHISMQAKIIRSSSCSEKSGKTGKNAPSVTGGQRSVTLCAGVTQGGYYTRCFKRGYLALKLNFAALNVSMEKSLCLQFRDL